MILYQEVKELIKQENLDRNLKNLAQLLPLNKVEEVRLVYVANFFDAEKLVEKVGKVVQGTFNVSTKTFTEAQPATQSDTNNAQSVVNEPIEENSLS